MKPRSIPKAISLDSSSLHDVTTWANRVGISYLTFVRSRLWKLLESSPQEDGELPQVVRVLIALHFVLRFRPDATALFFEVSLGATDASDTNVPICAKYESDEPGDRLVLDIDESGHVTILPTRLQRQ